MHDLLALRDVPRTVLLATHIGLYRSSDAGGSWAEVAGGSGQPMDGLMLYKLAQSPVDPQRVYVLSEPRPDNPKAARSTPGVYTSADAGKTWTLAAPLASFPTHAIYTIGAGSAAPGQVFTLVPSLGNHSLYESDDAGVHWHPLAPLPTTSPTGIAGDVHQPGKLWLWSSADGLFTSSDSGVTWGRVPGVQGGIFSASFAGDAVYANGDQGVFVSAAPGTPFVLVDGQDTFSSIVACESAPEHAYAMTGTGVYRTSDGGHTWTPTATLAQHPGGIAVAASGMETVYVGSSYPLGVTRTTDGGAHWQGSLP